MFLTMEPHRRVRINFNSMKTNADDQRGLSSNLNVKGKCYGWCYLQNPRL